MDLITTSNANGITVVMLGVMLTSAVITDIRTHRISNAMVVAILVLGLVSHLLTQGYNGIVDWGAGAAVGLGLFLPFYVAGGMGAGDVKLLAAVGCVIGPIAALYAGGIALLAGVPLALFAMVRKQLRLRAALRQEQATPARHSSSTAMADIHEQGQRIPYALAIAVGAIAGVWQSGLLATFIGELS